MKYTNTYNGHTYWISEGKVKVSNGEIVRTSNMDIPTFNAMIFNGDMVAIEVNKENFTRLVNVAKAESPNHNVRFLAFVEHMGKDAWQGTTSARMARFMAWIDDRKADYEKAYPGATNPGIGGSSIINQDHFTNFIVGGEWIK